MTSSAPIPIRAVLCTLVLLATPGGAVFAESPAPTVHWGGLSYPDQSPLLTVGFTGNRFTEFDGGRRRFNNIDETMGLNFISVSWTEHWKAWPGWSTNLTVGAGPTSDEPTQYLQNEFVHDAIFGIPKVPVGRVRGGADFMIDASVTRWWTVFGRERLVYAGAGFSTGSLYHETFGRAGIRRLPIASPLVVAGDALVRAVSFGVVERLRLLDWLKGLGLSAMGRYGRSFSGSAFREVAPQTWFAQASLSWGVYNAEQVPWVELELGAAVDSGLFTSLRGDALEVRFWTAKLQIQRFAVETWNDQLNRQDYGPTYGFRVTYDLRPLLFGDGG